MPHSQWGVLVVPELSISGVLMDSMGVSAVGSVNRECFIHLWCPLFGHMVRLSDLRKHRDRKHRDVPVADLKQIIRKRMGEGTLRYRDRTPSRGNIPGGGKILAKQRATNKVGIRRVVSGGRGKRLQFHSG